MKRRTKSTYLTQAELNESALRTPHQFQTIAVRELLAHKWRVSRVSTDGIATVVCMRMISDSSIGTAIYPNGAFSRSRSPTIKWDWKRARDAADATIPDAFVTTILEREKAA